jgi:hypothetical protein
MASLSPLQIVLVRHPDDLDVILYEAAIARAFQGGKEAGGYLATGEDLGIQLEIFSALPAIDVPEVLDGFCHTLVVVIADHNLLNNTNDQLWDWLERCWAHTTSSNGRHAMLVISMDERVGRQVSAKRAELQTLQLLQVHELGERAIRPAMLALRLVHECRIRITSGLWPKDREAGHLRIFISHAKIDGLPLAHALKHQIETLGWLEDFYDADDIPPGSDWQKELEKGVGTSLIVILRTESYDGRPWCQQEVLWADEYATPALVVDARTNLNHPAGILPLDRMPTVRIPDGNLMRILFLALRESLRFLLFIRRIEQMKHDHKLPSPVDLRIFCFQPSMSALLRACQSLAMSHEPPGTPRVILYPDPPFRAGTYEAAQALVAAYLPGGSLTTPQTIAATSGGVA